VQKESKKRRKQDSPLLRAGYVAYQLFVGVADVFFRRQQDQLAVDRQRMQLQQKAAFAVRPSRPDAVKKAFLAALGDGEGVELGLFGISHGFFLRLL